MSDNYNTGVLGDGSFYWWQGQIVDDSTWQTNLNPEGHIDSEKPGWGHRYKVRIIGQHTPDKKTKPPDEQLPMAEVLLPVTAGSGILGSKQTSNLSQGDFVIGFYKDGMGKNEPVILGTYSTGSQTKLFPGDPSAGFIPRSGYKGLSGDKIVYRKDQVGDTGQPRENVDDPNQAPASNIDQDEDFDQETQLENNCEKKNSEMKGIQLIIKNLLKAVNFAKKAAKTVKNALALLAAGPSFLLNELNKASQLISGFVKSILARVRGYIVTKMTNAIKDVTALVFPNKRQKLQLASEKAVNVFYCVLEKIIDKLVELITKLLTDLIDKYINAPICAIEQFLGNLIGSLMGQIMDGITSAMAPLISLVQSIGSSVGSIVDGVMNALNIASNILEFFSCDSAQECPEYDAWSWGSGAIQLPSPSAALGKKLEEWTGNIDIPGGGSPPPCNTSGIPCGPPTLQFSGGGNVLGSASGNAIVSSVGAILGVDLTGSGSGYTSPPTISVVDSCGLGKGAVLQAVFDPLLTGPDLTPVTVGGNGGTSIYAGGTGGTPVTTPDGTPITAGGTGGTPVVTGITRTQGTGGTPVTTPDGTPITAGGTGGTPVTTPDGTPITAGGTGGTPITAGGTGGIPVVTGITRTQGTGDSIPIITTSGIPLTAGGTGGIPVYAGGNGGTPVITSTGTEVYAGGNGGTPVTSLNGIPVVVKTPLGGVIAVQVIDPGFGYLPAPNGSVGGNGDVFANNIDAIYTSPSGNIDSYPPGTTINVTEGGTIGLPAGSTAEIYDNEGNLAQTVVGVGLLSPTKIDFGGQIYSLYESLIDRNLGNIPSQNADKWLLLSKDFEVSASTQLWDTQYAYSNSNVIKYDSVPKSGTITIPQSVDTNITVIGQSSNLSSGNTYPVVLHLEEVVIDDSGYLYNPSDNIFITPSNGTELQVEYDQFGKVSKVNVIKTGSGFTDIPEIGIISLTGYNARIRPILRPRRIGEGEEIPQESNIISVIDCVGKV